MNNKSNSSINIGFTGLLQLTFIILKLCKVINWSWWWVLAPFWIPLALVVIILIITGIVIVAACAKNVK